MLTGSFHRFLKFPRYSKIKNPKYLYGVGGLSNLTLVLLSTTDALMRPPRRDDPLLACPSENPTRFCTTSSLISPKVIRFCFLRSSVSPILSFCFRTRFPPRFLLAFSKGFGSALFALTGGGSSNFFSFNFIIPENCSPLDPSVFSCCASALTARVHLAAIILAAFFVNSVATIGQLDGSRYSQHEGKLPRR